MKQNEFSLLSKIKICRDCKEPFVLSSGERQFVLDRKLTEPSRCPECRSKRRNEGGET